MAEAEDNDLATAARSLRSRRLPSTKPITQCGPGERAMRAAYGYLDGTFLSPKHAAKEFCCKRQHVDYYVRKLVGQGIARSDASLSVGNSNADSQ